MSKTVAKKECHICHWLFNRSSNLYKHLRRVHGIEPTIQYGTIRCPNPECLDKFRLYEKLRYHMTDSHGIVIKRTVHRFPTEKDFKEWKKIVELSMMCKYSIFSSKAIVSGGVMVYYKCNRSGYFESKSTGRKHYESMLMNGHCPSTMNVKICENRVKVLFYQTHYGHDFDIKYLSRSKRISVENAIKLLEDNPMDNNLYGLENSDVDSNSNESSSEIDKEMENKELEIEVKLLKDNPMDNNNIFGLENSDVDSNSNESSSEIDNEMENKELEIEGEKLKMKLDIDIKNKETEDKEIQKSIKEIEKILNQDPVSSVDSKSCQFFSTKLKLLEDITSGNVFSSDIYEKANNLLDQCINIFQEAVEYQSSEPSSSSTSEEGPTDFEVFPSQLPVPNQNINHFYLNSEILPYKKIKLEIINQEK